VSPGTVQEKFSSTDCVAGSARDRPTTLPDEGACSEFMSSAKSATDEDVIGGVCEIRVCDGKGFDSSTSSLGASLRMMRAGLSDITAIVREPVTCGGLDLNHGSPTTSKDEVGWSSTKSSSRVMFCSATERETS
jgi:hypothetical protein